VKPQGTPSDTCEALTGALWSCCALPPGDIVEPNGLTDAAADWLPVKVPGTVAAALQAQGKWDHQHPVDLDAQDWWFRTTFPAPARGSDKPCVLCFDGLATLAEVWLNGEHILKAENMFRAYRADVSRLLQDENDLVVVFRSISTDLKKRRPRPRWKTNLVTHQQLRWHRSSLLGRIPGWTPPVPAVGPWKDVRLECGPVLLHDFQRTATLDGTDGLVAFYAEVDACVKLTAARIQVGEHETALTFDGTSLRGELRLPKPDLWWPHTHGTPRLHACQVVIDTESGARVFPLEPVGFRQLERRDEPGFSLHINGEPVYCRGACWTTSDIFTLSGSADSLHHDLCLARDAGMNMIRIGGTMIYENDTFYRLCDELGILVWQDFMFANMDYPVEDGGFAENIATEARQQLDRLAQHPCVAVYCGSSEIEQQAAMLGMPRELWRNRWFGEDLPALCRQRHPGTTYVPSSPSGGVLPFHARTGVTHYYGIGAYLRSMHELRQADVKFTSECLGFANLPEPEVMDQVMGGLMPVVHHPRWKQRVPRDTGSAWDFEDVRDHYLRELFGVDPATLRSFDMPRYLELSRLASGEMMARAFSEWRSAHSRNAGALVWFFKDLWAATGWGIVDHRGIPKAAYYQVKRTWQTRQLTITDEGLDGLHLHLINETNYSAAGYVEVQLMREPHLVISKHEVAQTIEPRSKQTLSVDEILGSFYDVNYAYRFGPQSHHVVIATWFNAQREVISEAFHLTRARDPEAQALSPDALKADAICVGEGRYQLALQSDRFLHSLRLEACGFLPDDNYFHLPPGRLKTVTFTALPGNGGAFRASVQALNLVGEVSVVANAQT
jgi:beta-mannosidase